MKKLHLPYVKLPEEFVTLLKSDLAVVSSPAPVFDLVRPNRALYRILENAFKEFDDGRGIEKLLTALGWSNFRDRMASLYIYKSIYGNFPTRTDMDLVDDIKKMEASFVDHGVHGYSRLFLLGFYMRLANVQTQTRMDSGLPELTVPEEIRQVLKLSQGRSEKLDWLILTLMHLASGLGVKVVMNAVINGKKLDEIYSLMPFEERQQMHRNMLAYGASINEPDFFLYEKV